MKRKKKMPYIEVDVETSPGIITVYRMHGELVPVKTYIKGSEPERKVFDADYYKRLIGDE